MHNIWHVASHKFKNLTQAKLRDLRVALYKYGVQVTLGRMPAESAIDRIFFRESAAPSLCQGLLIPAVKSITVHSAIITNNKIPIMTST